MLGSEDQISRAFQLDISMTLTSSASTGSNSNQQVASIKRRLWQIFTQQHGLILKSDVVGYLVTFVIQNKLSEELYGKMMSQLATSYYTKLNTPEMVDVHEIDSILVNMLKRRTSNKNGDILDCRPFCHLVNASQLTRWNFVAHDRKFVKQTRDTRDALTLFGDASEKIAMFNQRFLILKDRAVEEGINVCTFTISSDLDYLY
jgi:hypothetical protein